MSGTQSYFDEQGVVEMAVRLARRRGSSESQACAANFLELLATKATPGPDRSAWFSSVRERERARDAEIAEMGTERGERVNPVHFFQCLEESLPDDSVLVVDGGDFVATAAYILKPRSPLSWLFSNASASVRLMATGASSCVFDSAFEILV